jgi:thioredoxin 1
MPARVNGELFEEAVLKEAQPVLVDFYSDSCVPCKRMSPLLAELEEEYAGKVKVVKVNTPFERPLAEQYEVQSVPTLILFQNGQETARLSGAVKKAQIKEILEQI